MPSNTVHIQQRAQLKQHDDLVIATDERNEWQDGQNEIGLPSTPGVHSRPAPVRECAVSTIHSQYQKSDRLNKVQTRQCPCGKYVIAGKRCPGCGRQN